MPRRRGKPGLKIDVNAPPLPPQPSSSRSPHPATPTTFPTLPPPSTQAVCHTYDPETETWERHAVTYSLARDPFAHGSLRSCSFIRLGDLPPTLTTCVGDQAVAKAYLAPEADVPHNYMSDVKAQAYAHSVGLAFSASSPSTPVEILLPVLLELCDPEAEEGPIGSRGPLVQVERHVDGEYTKYNNNGGAVGSLRVSDEHQTLASINTVRSTPQAFSHFSYVFSGGWSLIVDIQGVMDVYTDPVVHTLDRGPDAPLGNLGAPGMASFFKTHLCSPICAKLGLPPFLHSSDEEKILLADRIIGTTIPASPFTPNPSWKAARAHAFFVDSLVSGVSNDLTAIAELPTEFETVNAERAELESRLSAALQAHNMTSFESGPHDPTATPLHPPELLTAARDAFRLTVDARLHYLVAQQYIRDRPIALFHLLLAANMGCQDAQMAIRALKTEFASTSSSLSTSHAPALLSNVPLLLAVGGVAILSGLGLGFMFAKRSTRPSP